MTEHIAGFVIGYLCTQITNCVLHNIPAAQYQLCYWEKSQAQSKGGRHCAILPALARKP